MASKKTPEEKSQERALHDLFWQSYMSNTIRARKSDFKKGVLSPNTAEKLLLENGWVKTQSAKWIQSNENPPKDVKWNGKTKYHE